MNKIRIATNDMALTVKMSDEQANVWFGTLTRALLGEYPDIAEPVEVEEPTPQERYKGFLRITCAHCGETAVFNTKAPIKAFKCNTCGQMTNLHDLHRLKFRCECGHTWVYHTNATERIIEQNCLACGMPMQAEQDKNGDYSPL